ncbi:MAG: aromatic ring-hydroxylating dioxygenase subunit alpha [Planctomycetota bacterium]
MTTPRDELAAQPLERATALPARFYCEPGMAALDRRLVFDRGWQLIGHVSQLQGPGDHVVGDLAGLPVIAVRGSEGLLRVLHNVCRHRAGPIATCDGFAARSLRCRYHGWNYGLDGVLRSAPEMGQAVDFELSAVRLPQLEARVWQGMVFAAVDAGGIAFDELVHGIDERLGADRGLAAYGHHHRVGYDVDCNWKVYVDNYLEGYHVPHIHPGLTRLLDYRSYETKTARLHSCQWSPLESGAGLYGAGDALYYWLWPNTMLNILPGRLQANRVIPRGADRCRVVFDFYYPLDDSEAGRERREADFAFSDEVQAEDVAICEAVQRGLASGSYVPGRLNPLRENAVHHFHELLREVYRDGAA